MFTKCCGCTKKVSKTKTDDNLTNESTYTKQPSLRKSDTNTDLNHTDTDSKDNASTKPVTPVLLLPSDDNSPSSTMPEIVSSTNNKSSSDSSTRQDTTEIKIEDVCDTNSISDDDVFQEGVGAPIQLAANLATPYPLKKGSIPGLPRWFSEDDDQESGGTQEPPATPVGKDELALRRHRFFSELMTAAQAAAEHRVRFDPLGPVVAGDEQFCNHQGLITDLESLIVRLETVTNRLETSAGINILAETAAEKEEIKSSPSPVQSPTMAMTVYGFQDILAGPFAQYLTLSKQIGGDVATHSDLVDKAFQAQLQYLTIASQSKQPSQTEQMQLLQPTSEHINAIQTFREKNRTSQYFNHLSAISESVPALGWVTVSPTPAPYVKEMNDAGQFYTNRVLKDWKEKDKKHVDWVKSWVQTLSDLQQYVKQHHTTGLVWSGKGGVPPPPPPSCPPPPPVMNMADLSVALDDASQDRSALFAQINQGEGITKSLKKVTSDMQTHKNTTLRTGPAPFKAPSANSKTAAPSMPVEKPPNFVREGKKWLVEYQKSNKNLVIDGAEMNNVVYMYKCVDSTLIVKGKLNSVIVDSCKKSSVVFDSLVSSVEFINCQSVQMQVLGKVPTISVDKTDGCQMYLSPDSLNVEIISSKSSEMNVMVPKGNGDYTEYPVPEQYKTTVVPGKGLSTIIVENKG